MAFAILTGLAAATLALAASPAPTPTGRCWIFDAIHPATPAAYRSEHLSASQQREIEKWAKPSSPAQDKPVAENSPLASAPSRADLGLLRWMRSRDGFLVFVIWDIHSSVAHTGFFMGGYAPWVALNSNIIIDTVDCSVHAYPTA